MVLNDVTVEVEKRLTVARAPSERVVRKYVAHSLRRRCIRLGLHSEGTGSHPARLSSPIFTPNTSHQPATFSTTTAIH